MIKKEIPSGWTEGETGSAWKLSRAKEYFFAKIQGCPKGLSSESSQSHTLLQGT
jgi:hypothetical protein